MNTRRSPVRSTVVTTTATIVVGALVSAVPSTASAALVEPDDVSVVTAGVPGTTDHNNFDLSDDGRYVAFGYRTESSPGVVQLLPFVYDASTGEAEQVMTTSDGNPPTSGIGVSRGLSISDDGGLVAYDSFASNLVPGDANATSDVFVYDRESQTTVRASVGTTGAEGNGYSFEARISGDGEHVVFTSHSSNLVPGDTNGAPDVFVKDLVTGDLVRVSNAPNGSAAGGANAQISDDGTRVVFQSDSPLVADDTNATNDVFVAELPGGSVTRVSESADGAQGDRYSFDGAISGDGRYVAFVSSARTLFEGVEPSDGDYQQIYRRDLATDDLVLVTQDPNGDYVRWPSQYPVLSDNGRYIGFFSYSGRFVPHPTPLDSGTAYVRDLDNATTVATLRSPSGAVDADTGPPRLSGDGRVVVNWSGSTNVLPGVTAGALYRWDRGDPDVTDPSVTVDQAPDATTADPTPTFAFSSPDGGRDFECALARADEDPVYSYCTSPSTEPNLDDGSYRFSVRVTDRSGNRSTSVSHDFEVVTGPPDETAPATIITNLPDTVTTDDTPTLEFRADEDGVTFECSLSTGANDYKPCTSPMTYLQQPQGDYTFRVRATDVAGNTGDAVSVRFTIDTGPTVSLDSGPANPTGASTPTFGFIVSEPGTTVECSLSAADPDYAPCTSPVTFPAQPDGETTFQVRATGSDGDTGPPTIYTFRIDTSGPSVAIDGGPGDFTDDTTPSFDFSSPEDGVTFECSLESSPADDFEPCTSPATYGPLTDNVYTFKVRATDALGNVGEPSLYVFLLDAVQVAAPSTPDLAPASDTGVSSTDDITTDTTPTFTGTAQTGTTVTIYAGGQPRGSALTTDQGTYTVTTSALPLATYDVTAVAAGAGGETSPASASLTVQIIAATTPTACTTATATITGTNAANTIRGTAAANLINALGGNDTVTALGGNDCVHAGSGNDTVNGNAGNDELNGDTGTDELIGAAGADVLRGGDDNDTLRGGAGADTMIGGNGVDRIYAVDGTVDTIDCGPGAGEIATVDTNDVVTGCETVRRR